MSIISPSSSTPPKPERNQYISELDKILAIQFDQPKKKREHAYGLRLAKEMWSYISFGNEGYYQSRYVTWNTNRLWAKGNVENREFMDLMGVEGNQSWINIDWKILKLVPSFLNRVVQIFMEREERPNVRATDAVSASFREREKIFARMRMQNSEKISQMEAAAGFPLEDSNSFTPQDEDELDMYYKIEWRLPEESFFEDEIWKVWMNSDYEYLKREILRDLCIDNIAILKQERVPGPLGFSETLGNRLRQRRVLPKNSVYNIFQNSNGSDVSIIGEARVLKISDGRREFPQIGERKWFEIAQLSQKGMVQAEPLNWIDSYIYNFNRPYDDYSVIVFDFEVKVYDQEYYVKGENFFDKKNGVPKPGPDKEVINNGKFNVYQGVWVVSSDIMLKWDIAPNQIRPYQNGVDVFSNYSIVYPHADGFYVPSLIERGIPCVRQMILTALRIQQMIALMEPDNLSVDVAGLRDVQIGTGKSLTPLQLMKVKQQTGVVYWDSTDTSGVGGPGNPIPFQNIPNGGNVAQINVLIAVYNWWLQRLNEEWGVSQEVMAQPTPGKKSAAATQQASLAGGLSIEYIYDYFIMLFEQASTKIGYTLWDDVVFNAKQYKEWAGINRDLIETTFDIDIDMLNKSESKQTLLMMIQEALAAKTITLATAARLKDIPNPKTAVLYLEKLEKKAKKDAAQMQQRQMEMNARVQQQSTQIATQGKIQEIQAQGQMKALIEKMKGDESAYKELVKLINEVEKETVKQGIEFPADLAPVRNVLISGIMQDKAQQDQLKGEQQEGSGDAQGQDQSPQQ